MPVNILGISAFYHDSAAALVTDGVITAAVQEERLSRRKHDPSFPKGAVRYCLDEGGISLRDIDYLVFYDKPWLKFERILETYIAFAPKGLVSFLMSMPVWVKEKLFLSKMIEKELAGIADDMGSSEGFRGRILYAEHHLSHAASAYYPSPFERAAVLTIDGVGEWATTSCGVGSGNTLKLVEEMHFPHSLGLLYSAFTYFAGFKVNSGEYKLMGLAPYGEPVYTGLIYDRLLDLKEDGSFRLNMEYFEYPVGLKMTGRGFETLFGGPRRKPESPVTRREMDIARSIQEVTEEIMLRMARHIHDETGEKNLCLAGGVALNCVGNGRLLREGPFDNIWIQPAAGDAGGALGAALSVWHDYLGMERRPVPGDSMRGSYLGPSYSTEDVESFLKAGGLEYERLAEDDLMKRVASHINDGKVIGWFQGRTEFGPRALGNRSIIGDPRSPQMQSIMNLKIKYRESFRPFAPAVLEERAADYFVLDRESPYMLLVAPVREGHRRAVTRKEEGLFGIDKLNVPRSDIPAVTHVDYSARVQTVSRDTNPMFWRLIKEFEGLTGCPVLINTSFNVRGEPIVNSPKDAYLCFMRTEMDYLVLGDFVLDKSRQRPLATDNDWQSEFGLD